MKKLALLLSSLVVVVAVAFLGFQAREASGTGCGIGNITKSFDPLACEVTITWTTSCGTQTNLVRWGQSGCVDPSYPYVVSGGSGGTHHSAVIDVTGHGPKINFQIESTGNCCGTETTGCMTAVSGPCIAE